MLFGEEMLIYCFKYWIVIFSYIEFVEVQFFFFAI
jgi:hypothetical protein